MTVLAIHCLPYTTNPQYTFAERLWNFVCVCVYLDACHYFRGHIVHFYAQTKVPRVLVRYYLSFSLAYLPKKNFIQKLWHYLLDTTAFGAAATIDS